MIMLTGTRGKGNQEPGMAERGHSQSKTGNALFTSQEDPTQGCAIP